MLIFKNVNFKRYVVIKLFYNRYKIDHVTKNEKHCLQKS